jgi:hemerythrin
MGKEKFKWSSKYSVGVKLLDYDHQELFSIIDEFERSLASKTQTDAINSIVHRLQTYAMEHFQREEHIMSEYGFSNLIDHQLKHHSFIRLVYAVRHILSNCPEKLSYNKLLIFLQRWLTHHIMVEDMSYKDHIHGGVYGNRATDIVQPLTSIEERQPKENQGDKRKPTEWEAVTVHVPAHAIDIIKRCARLLQTNDDKTMLLDELTNPIGSLDTDQALRVAKIVLL